MILALKKIFCSIVLSLGLDAPCGIHIEKTVTPLTEEQLLEALSESHRAVFGRKPGATRLAMAWAQVAFENGRGALVYNNNLGNIGTNPRGPRRPYYRLAGSRFKSFSHAVDGGKAYWRTLRDRCSAALASFDVGDAVTTSSYLDRCGYYTANVDHYTKNLSSLFNEARLNMSSW